ncbi:MarR family winged helix-turn-helix transcriptional regulator [Pseudomonas sp. Marseille-QA0892]
MSRNSSNAAAKDGAATPSPWLDNLVGYALRRAQMKVFQHLVDQLSQHDLRPAQFTAMAIIEQEPGLMQADLARKLAIEPPQLVLLLNKLESRGLAERVRAKQDKRSYGLYLSKEGKALLRKLKKLAEASDSKATEPLDEDERAHLLALLHKINRATPEVSEQT